MAIQTINPATGEKGKVFVQTSSEEVDRLLSQAESAFAAWKVVPVAERIAAIQRVASLMADKKEELAKLITLEVGRPYKDSLSEIEKSLGICSYYIANGERILQEQHVPTEASKSYIEYAPLGVILGIMPWNFPFTQVFRPLVPALIAGNVFVLKHASNVPQCALAIEKLFAELDFPKGVVTNLLLEGEAIQKVIADDRIAAVTVTGSEQTGRRVAETAGAHLKKTVLELGGSDAFIVLEDADIAMTVQQAVKARTLNAGQACNSPKRFILSHRIAKEFTEKFVKAVQLLKVGDPMEAGTDVGPLARADLRELLDRQIQGSLAKGARLLHGGKRIAGEGNFYEVTVVDSVKKGMPLFDEEVFGPVIVFLTAKDDADAVQLANDTHLGLSASVWTKDIARAHWFIDQLHVGLVFVNQAVRSDPRLPFGGVKKSGYGRELGELGIREFVNIKTIVVK